MSLTCRVSIFSLFLLTLGSGALQADCTWTSPAGTSVMYTSVNPCSVGIGVTSPNQNAQLDLIGAIRIAGVPYPSTDNAAWIVNEQGVGLALQSAGSIRLRGGAADRVTIDLAGNVGIGLTPNTSAKLDVSGAIRLPGTPYPSTDNAAWIVNEQGVGVALQSGGTLRMRTGASSVDRLSVDTTGQVSVGGLPPGTLSTDKLVVNGTVRGVNVIATYQDVAEWVPASHSMEPGTVVVIDGNSDNGVTPSLRAYDTSIAGVVTAQPGVLLGVADPSKEKIATTGRVKVRVDATRLPIRRGDLLVSSDKSGVAMRSEPVDVAGVRMHCPGTVIGKALEPLPGGQGEILVLLSLQ